MARSAGGEVKDDGIGTFVKFLSQTESRDKVTKCLQYGCRAVAWLLLDTNKDVSARLASLYKTSSDSRKIFRLGKFMNEYVKLRNLARELQHSRKEQQRLMEEDEGSMCLCSEAITSNTLQFVSRAGFMGYWIFDALSILSKIRVYKGNTPNLAKKAGGLWFIGLVFGLVFELYRLKRSFEREAVLKQQMLMNDSTVAPGGGAASDDTSGQSENRKSATGGGGGGAAVGRSVGSSSSCPDSCEIEKQLIKERGNRKTYYINAVKNCGDLITASNMVEIPHTIIGRGFNDGIIGLGGFTSAFLTCWQLFK
eukprot:GHVS01048015.1.p1 GENE.GHVS01048015.1~~GHVS01048015.1.p1  ORF type:complete len:309 (+),score=52.76 GHVS01048015.1:105-1031(+)